MALVECRSSFLVPDASSTIWQFGVCCSRGDDIHYKYAEAFYQSKVTDLFPPFPSECIRSYKGETSRQVLEAWLCQKCKGWAQILLPCQLHVRMALTEVRAVRLADLWWWAWADLTAFLSALFLRLFVETEDFLIKETIWVLFVHVCVCVWDGEEETDSVRTRSLKMKVTSGQNYIIVITLAYICIFPLMCLKAQEAWASKCLMCGEVYSDILQISYTASFKPLEKNILGKWRKASRAIIFLEKKERERLAKWCIKIL